MSGGSEMRELLDEFLFESREQLRDVESTLMELEQCRIAGGEVDRSAVDRVFRAFHTVKGTAGFLGFENLVRVTHRAESLLDLVRQGKAPLSESLVTAACDALDFATRALDVVDKSESDDALQGDANTLVDVLEAAYAGANGAKAPAKAAAPAKASPAAEVEQDAPDAEPSIPENDDVEEEPAPAEVRVAAKAPESRAKEAKSDGDGESRQAVRVDVDKLDTLMNVVGELILAETMVTHNEVFDRIDTDLESFHKAVLHLNRVTRTLQDIAMSMRMSPIRGTFRRMLRVVRDLSHKLGKDVELELSGEDTEIDRNLVEAIGDPLVHILRNSMDHGIELPADRVAAGKSARGKVLLSARHQGGEVWITIEDDGRGLNRARILDKARRQGLISDDGDSMSDPDVWDLIFRPGFSTAEALTDVSGRGVGMDVVRRNIEAVNGRVDVFSREGHGTTLTLRIPLTLAIIDGMLVQVGQTYYAVPLLAIRESFSGNSVRVTNMPNGDEVVHLRGAFVPLVRLGRMHGNGGETQVEDGVIMLVDTGGRPAALLVDRMVGQRQTVVKGLPSYLGQLPGVSGCSILNNGDISLILDPKTLLEPLRRAA